MFSTLAFGIDENIIKVYYHENVKLFCQDLIDIALKYGQCISQSKKHHPVLEIAIAAFEGRFPFIAFSNCYLMVGVDEIELDKMSSPT